MLLLEKTSQRRPLVEGIVALPRFGVRSRSNELYCWLRVVTHKNANEGQRVSLDTNAFVRESRMQLA